MPLAVTVGNALRGVPRLRRNAAEGVPYSLAGVAKPRAAGRPGLLDSNPPPVRMALEMQTRGTAPAPELPNIRAWPVSGNRGDEVPEVYQGRHLAHHRSPRRRSV